MRQRDGNEDLELAQAPKLRSYPLDLTVYNMADADRPRAVVKVEPEDGPHPFI